MKLSLANVAPSGTGGVKHDIGKLRWDLLPTSAVEKIVAVLTFGAAKYGANNWQALDEFEPRYYAALQRHLAAWRRGERIDPESDLPHLAHAACCLVFLLSREVGFDPPLDAPSKFRLDDPALDDDEESRP
jgi:hypothetical protein